MNATIGPDIGNTTAVGPIKLPTSMTHAAPKTAPMQGLGSKTPTAIPTRVPSIASMYNATVANAKPIDENIGSRYVNDNIPVKIAVT